MANEQDITTQELAIRAAILAIASDNTLLIKTAGVAGRLYEALTIGSGLSVSGAPGSKVLSASGGVDLNVKQRFDPTAALPASPTVGDVYLATATANGWTAGNLYTWNGTTYDETVPAAGMQIWIVATGTASIYSGTEWVDLEASSGDLTGTVSLNTLAMGVSAGVLGNSMLSEDASGNLFVNPAYAGNLNVNLTPGTGYDAVFKLDGSESYRIKSDLSVALAAGNWLEFGELNHYIRNKSNNPDLATSDLEIGSSYGNTVFLSGGGCWVASESLRVGNILIGEVPQGYGIQAPNVWDSGLLSSVVKTDANGKLVACSNLSDAAYQPSHAILTALAGLSYSSGTPFVKMTGAAAFSLDTATYQPLASNLTAISSITPVRGGLIVANATPQYAALALGGASGSILTRNATDPGWSAYYLAGTAGQTYTFPTTTPRLSAAPGRSIMCRYGGAEARRSGIACFRKTPGRPL